MNVKKEVVSTVTLTIVGTDEEIRTLGALVQDGWAMNGSKIINHFPLAKSVRDSFRAVVDFIKKGV